MPLNAANEKQLKVNDSQNTQGGPPPPPKKKKKNTKLVSFGFIAFPFFWETFYVYFQGKKKN